MEKKSLEELLCEKQESLEVGESQYPPPKQKAIILDVCVAWVCLCVPQLCFLASAG